MKINKFIDEVSQCSEDIRTKNDEVYDLLEDLCKRNGEINVLLLRLDSAVNNFLYDLLDEK